MDEKVQIIGILEAKRLGLIRYFTGLPCKHGHVEERVVSSRACVACQRSNVKAWLKKNPTKKKEYDRVGQRNWKSRSPERSREVKAKYRENNRDKIRSYGLKYYDENRPRFAENRKRYRREKPWLHAEDQRARECIKKRAMPVWVDRSALQEIYEAAYKKTIETGIVYSVDHIYPLRSKVCCGLHVPWNLQIIPLLQNLSKGNKLPTEWRVKSESGTN